MCHTQLWNLFETTIPPVAAPQSDEKLIAYDSRHNALSALSCIPSYPLRNDLDGTNVTLTPAILLLQHNKSSFI